MRAATLKPKFSQVTVAEDNQAVIDACETVCLSIRSQLADAVLGGLAFREDITVVSFVPVPTYTAPILQGLIGPVAKIVRAENADQFHALWATTSMLAPYFGLLGSVANLPRGPGVPAEAADSYVAAMFHSIADTGLKVRGEGFEEITSEHATPGGLNEQMLRELTHAGNYDNVSRGLSLIFERLNGRADLDDTIG